MKMAHKQDFADRMSRIQSGGANTCGVIHVGNTSNAKTSPKRSEIGAPTRASLMSKGLRSAVIQLVFFATCLGLYIRHVGL